MKGFVLDQIVKWLAGNLTAGKVKEWSDMLKGMILPTLQGYKMDLISKLRTEALKTDTVIDDVAVDALSMFLDAFLFDNK